MSWQKNLDTLSTSVKQFPFSLDWLPPEACLVGGAVRDALLNRQGEYLDLDFVMPKQAVETAQRLAQQYKAGFVLLDQKRQIARVVFEQGTIDFAQQEGDSLEKDLRRRDFTVNAIAYNLHNVKLIDPLQGLTDIKQGVLRMISQANLEDDPLRLLRAYRQAAQLDFTIETTTRSTIRTLAPLLETIAVERVQTELDYLLNNPQGNSWLQSAWEDNLLTTWYKNTTAEKLQQLAKIDQLVIIMGKSWSQFLSQSQWHYWAKLASLVSSIPEEAEAELIKLKYSRNTIRAVTIAIKYLPQLLEIETNPLTLREQYFFFLNVGNIFPIIVLLAIAKGIKIEAIAPLINCYFNPNDQIAHPTPLVTGHDLIQALKIKPSPLIGKLLTELQIARIEGKISTPEDALKLALHQQQMQQNNQADSI